MNISFGSLILSGFALGGAAMADVPKLVPITRYASLWTNSPFTSKPPPAPDAPVANPLEDYALIGVSSIGLNAEGKNRYRVTMINKKSPEERIFVDSDQAHKDGFQVVSVSKKSGDPLATTVKMISGSQTGTLKFDNKLLTLATVPVHSNPGQAAGQNPAQNPVQPQPQQAPGQSPQPIMRQPRARVVQPPSAAPANVGAGQQNQGQRNANERRDRRRP